MLVFIGKNKVTYEGRIPPGEDGYVLTDEALYAKLQSFGAFYMLTTQADGYVVETTQYTEGKDAVTQTKYPLVTSVDDDTAARATDAVAKAAIVTPPTLEARLAAAEAAITALMGV